MADTIGIILKYLHQHHFTRAEEVLREEVSLRQQSNGPDLVPLNDDLDLEVAMCLKSVQEKTTQKHAELKAVPNKPAQDKLVTDVKPSAALRLAAKEEPHGHVEPLWSSMKAEVSEPLFMEFEVKDFERSTKLHSTLDVGSSPSQVSLSPISQKKMIERRKSPGRIGGLSVLQTEAEMGAISSIEKVTPDLKEAEASNASPGNVASDSCIGGVFTPTSQRKELLPGHEADPPQAHFEATRGKVDALKQTESNGQSTDVQDSATFLPEATIEVQLAPRNEIKANATLPTDSKSEDVSAGSLNFTVPKSPEWAEVPIKTIPLIKTSVSLAADSKKSFEEGGKETISINPPHLYPERLQTGTKQELVPQAFGKQDTGSQYAAVSSDELKTSYTIEQSTVEGPSSTIVERKLTCVAPRSVQEGLPKLAPVRLRSIDAKSLEAVQDEYASGMKKSVESSSPGNVAGTANAIPFGLGSYLDVPVGQDVSSSGSRRIPASARPSVSHGIVEDQSELLSGFATAGDVQSESAVEYADECWDSDTYEDDDDPGYLRQPIEDEEWFLAHEIDYPSDDERARPNEEAARSSRREKDYEKYEKDEEEGCSVLEEEIADATRILDPDQFDRQLLGAVNVPLMDSDTRWRNFDASKGIQSEEEGVKKPDHGRAVLNNHVFVVEDDRMGSVRFGGVGVSSDVADFGSERRQSVPGESGEGDLDIGEIGDRSMGQTRLSPQLRNSARGKAHESESNRKQDEEEEEEDLILKYYNNPWASHKRRGVEREVSTLDILHLPNSEKENSTMEKVSNVGEGRRHKESETAGTTGFGGFSFPSPSTSGGDIGAVSRVDSGKSLWSVRDITGQMLGEEADYGNGVSEPDDPLASWRRKSNESSPMLSPRNDGHRDLSVRSTGSASSTAGYGSTVAKDENAGEGDDEVEQDVEEEDTLEVHQKIRDTEAVAAEDEEAAAVQEQIRRIRAEEEEFETFDLKIIHRKNRTGFEEDKDFPVVINAVVAGRYHVTEYLGSAAFSTAIQAHDLLTGMDVCMKIIKNNKDFFDQSLDEIKLLKYINKHDPGDKHHLLRLYDYFYHREHLFIVCELLRANLYEFHKYNRESGGEVYFTMPRLQSIARQCLEALEFIHSLGLIHCDLKPENILVKSYSRCEIKVIDLGSSCFQTDHLCPYVQSRSYRAPEVILGLPYDHKIDMWSLGCILAELCSGNVLFQNDSLATLLARVVGILGPIEPELLSKGRDTHKFFTKNHTLYERNQDSDQLEYLLPKKTSLAHRLPMGDQGFVEFVGYLLNINPLLRPNASEALKHPWLLFPYEPISS
uniref:Protein kinase domain-containing protein n=1 Tax=Physcomitrium patens TaxID=3218 RepID=A0A2K1KV64_PHYPA|nr:hypothetical protein PHYPA_004645 [Physcomitrium patens]